MLKGIDELQGSVLNLIWGLEGRVLFQSLEHLLLRVDEVSLLQKCRILSNPLTLGLCLCCCLLKLQFPVSHRTLLLGTTSY